MTTMCKNALHIGATVKKNDLELVWKMDKYRLLAEDLKRAKTQKMPNLTSNDTNGN